jgi:hypothetical protein
MIRPTEYTRHAIIKAAVDLFAEKGFEGAIRPRSSENRSG